MTARTRSKKKTTRGPKPAAPKKTARKKHSAPQQDMHDDEYLARVLRVNHAGEFGAQRIYQGQLAVLGNSEIGPLLQHMADQEEEHLRYFENQLVERRIRPTALHPFWNAAGWLLGAGTAMLGKEAAMACTVAVEEVIDAHYAEQLEKLGTSEKSLKAKIRQFQAEELEHRDIGLENNAEQAPRYEALVRTIKAGCRLAIWLSKRV